MGLKVRDSVLVVLKITLGLGLLCAVLIAAFVLILIFIEPAVNLSRELRGF